MAFDEQLVNEVEEWAHSIASLDPEMADNKVVGQVIGKSVHYLHQLAAGLGDLAEEVTQLEFRIQDLEQRTN